MALYACEGTTRTQHATQPAFDRQNLTGLLQILINRFVMP